MTRGGKKRADGVPESLGAMGGGIGRGLDHAVIDGIDRGGGTRFEPFARSAYLLGHTLDVVHGTSSFG